VARRRSPATGFAIVILILGVGACSSGGEQTPRKAATSAVEIRVFSFKPSPIEVRRGETVTWSQRDNTMHTVTSGAPGSPDGRFRSDPLGEGETFSFTFESAGSFAYFCSIHDSMRGEVRVT
jgi:plastocyanin